jgi:L-cysteine/cystine lyase
VTFDEARAQFPVLERLAYLNAGSAGPLAQPTVEAMIARQRADLDQGRSGRPYTEGIRALRARVRERLAGLVGVPAQNLALTASTTSGCNIVLAGLRLGPDDEVVTTDSEHFGLLGALHASGARVRVARVCALPPERALETILAELGPKTRLVALSHVSWLTGNVLPVEELQELKGPPLLVDGAQTVGAVPVDAARYDFYTVSGQKWLCGPDATGALYVREPEQLAVALPTYLSQVVYDETGEYTPTPGAGRFDSGWLPAASLAGVDAALDTVPQWAYRHAAEIAARCWTRLAERFPVVTAPGQATLVSFAPGAEAAQEAALLYASGVVVRDLPWTGWLRVSCGWWTSDADLDRLLEAL